MKTKVYVYISLHFKKDDVKIIGVYSNRSGAQIALVRYVERYNRYANANDHINDNIDLAILRFPVKGFSMLFTNCFCDHNKDSHGLEKF